MPALPEDAFARFRRLRGIAQPAVMPQTLRQLEIALLEHHPLDVRAFFDAANIASGNEALMEAGREYGFVPCVSEEPPFNGHAIMLARDLARLMYGTEDTSDLGKLLRTYGFDCLRIGACGSQSKTLLTDHFHLSKFDSKATFATWQHFLILGMYGQTTHARKVKAYLLKREQASRIADTVEMSTGLSPRQLLDATNPWTLIKQMADAGYRQDQEIRALQTQQHETAVKLLQADAKAEQAQNQALRADTKADTALSEAHRMTVEHFIFANGLLRQFPPSDYRRISDWLRDLCLDWGWEVRQEPVYGKSWPSEKSYPLHAFSAWLRYEQHRPRQQSLQAVRQKRE